MVNENIVLTKSEKISLANKRRWSDLEKRKTQSEKLKIIKRLSWSNPKFRSRVSKKMSESKKGKSHKPHSKETKLKMSLNSSHYWKGARRTGEWRKNVSQKMKIYRAKTEVKNKTSEVSKKLWQDEIYRETVIKNALKGSRIRPTSLEQKWINVFKRKKLPYKYVGDGSFLIGWKNPDFVNTNGSKICIEVRPKVMCRIWDKITPEEYEKQRIEHFKKFGWDCIVLWDDTNE